MNTKKLTISGEKVNEYFAENQEAKEMVLELAASNGARFNVIVNKIA